MIFCVGERTSIDIRFTLARYLQDNLFRWCTSLKWFLERHFLCWNPMFVSVFTCGLYRLSGTCESWCAKNTYDRFSKRRRYNSEEWTFSSDKLHYSSDYPLPFLICTENEIGHLYESNSQRVSSTFLSGYL